MNKPWDRREGESELWYDRFFTYLMLGCGYRSVRAAFMICKEENPERITGQAPGHAWFEAALEWDWAGRAHQYDDEARARFLVEEQEFANDRRLGRLHMTAVLEKQVFAALLSAQIDEMSMEAARSSLGHLRLLLVSLLALDQAEFRNQAYDGEDATNSDLVDEIRRNLAKAWPSKAVPAMGAGQAPSSEVPSGNGAIRGKVLPQ